MAGGCSTREIARRLAADQISTPSGRRAIWGTSTISRLLRNEAYIGRVYFNRTETVPAPGTEEGSPTSPSRPADEWVTIPVPPIIDEQTFTAASKTMMDNTKWSPRRAEPGQWLLKGLVRCGVCGVGTNAHRMRGRNGSWHRYYYCRNHDPIRAGGADRRCPERNIRADALDDYVFDRIRAALLHPDTLLAGEQAVAARTPAPDDELLAAELARLDRKITAADDERRRLADLYQAGLLALPEVQRRAADRRTPPHRAHRPPRRPHRPTTRTWPRQQDPQPRPRIRRTNHHRDRPPRPRTETETPPAARRGSPRHRLERADPTPHPAGRRIPSTTPTPAHRCQAKTVCAPFVQTSGESVRLSQAIAGQGVTPLL